MNAAENLLSEWSSLLLSSLADAGVRDIVMSPGSRSTPFVAAALREPRLRLHDVIDERAASFVALGQARATGQPSLLLCTSGTAAAHYFPAIIEANASGLPLIVLTADRPLESIHCGAAQTIDQTKLFGEHVRGFFELGAPDGAALSLRALRRTAVQAHVASRYPVAGAVHINARARKPLEPITEATSEAGRSLAAEVARVRARPITQVTVPRSLPNPAELGELAERCANAERGLLVCGPLPASFRARDAVFELARRTGFPLLSELPSQLRLGRAPSEVVVCDGFDAVLRVPSFRRSCTPDLIVHLGASPTSTSWELYAETHPNAERVILSQHGWIDPASLGSHLVFGDLNEVVPALVELLPSRRTPPTAWEEVFARAGASYREAIDELLSTQPELTEGHCARIVTESLPDGSALMLGNSLPIRTAEAFARRRDADVTVLCQRGVNGIDGLVAGSVGAAQALAQPLTLYVGDVSLLHDLSSLMLARELAHPFVVVVVQNGGGRIFDQLPLGRGAREPTSRDGDLYRRTIGHICTPHSIRFEHAAALFAHDYANVSTQSELIAALERAYASARCTIIEVEVAPNGAVVEYDRLWRAVTAKLDPSSH